MAEMLTCMQRANVCAACADPAGGARATPQQTHMPLCCAHCGVPPTGRALWLPTPTGAPRAVLRGPGAATAAIGCPLAAPAHRDTGRRGVLRRSATSLSGGCRGTATERRWKRAPQDRGRGHRKTEGDGRGHRKCGHRIKGHRKSGHA
eukprot:364410-Chlamydomonas_euryale.AAC.2